MYCSLPGSSVLGIFQARVLEWVVISFSRGSSQPRDQTQVSCIAGRHFTVWATREAQLSEALDKYDLKGCLWIRCDFRPLSLPLANGVQWQQRLSRRARIILCHIDSTWEHCIFKADLLFWFSLFEVNSQMCWFPLGDWNLNFFGSQDKWTFYCCFCGSLSTALMGCICSQMRANCTVGLS